MTKNENVYKEICENITFIDCCLLLNIKFILLHDMYKNDLRSIVNYDILKHVTIQSCIENVKYKNAFETLSKNNINEILNYTSEETFVLLYNLSHKPFDKPDLESYKFYQDQYKHIYKDKLIKPKEIVNKIRLKVASKELSKPNIFKTPATIKWVESLQILNAYKGIDNNKTK